METENIENCEKLESSTSVATPLGSSKCMVKPDIVTESKSNTSSDALLISPSPIKAKPNSVLKPRNVGDNDKSQPKIENVEIMDGLDAIRKEASGCEADVSKTNKPAKLRRSQGGQASAKLEGRTELSNIYKEANIVLQRFKTALHVHRTKTFFRPDVVFIKSMSGAIHQIECGLNKMGQVFSSPNSLGKEEKLSSADSSVAITPPASEAGTDEGLNDSTNDTSSFTTNGLPGHNTSNCSNGTAVKDNSFTEQTAASTTTTTTSTVNPTDTIAKPKEQQESTRPRSHGRKRKLESNNDATIVTTLVAKRPRRSLLSQFLGKNEKDDKKKEEETEDKQEEEEEEADSEEKKDEEFEVEKILDYNRTKGKCLYHVRWRGYTSNDDTWEPLDNLTGCEEILLSFIRTRLVERSKVTDSEELKNVLLPCEEGVKLLLRGAFFAQLTAPKQTDVVCALPILISGKVKIREMPELEEDIDRLVATKDCLSDRYQKMLGDVKQQLVLRECNQQRQRQKAELRRWEREMSRISCAPAPLSVANDVDLSLPPNDFVYINEYIAGKGISIPQDPVVGCECTDCGNSQNTCCAKQMSSYFAYTKHGRLKVSLGTAIYECNKLCACAKTGNCLNRVVQKGRTVQLTIFRTANKRGWGVKAGETIRAGSFVTEYVGEVISSEEAERRGQIYDARGCTYLFDLDYNKGDLNPYTVDAAKYGNVSHFINHSCDPSLVVYNVWVNCLDPDLPKLALFSTREIKKGEEITFDYNTPSSRPQNNLPIVQDDGGLEGGEATIESPARSKVDVGSLEMSVCKTPKRGIVNGKTKCRCGAANCRQYFF